MRRFLLYSFVGFSLVFGMAGNCKKGSGGGGGGGGETPLAVTLNPPANSTQPAAPQADFPLTVSITSTMPPQGVTIDVSAKKDDGSGAPPFFTQTTNTSGANNNFNITGTPVGVVCITEVTVTSRTQATNKWTGSYRYSRKP